jgi:cytoskeletal protein RodZ
MNPEIGATLRDARIRQKVDMPDIEAETKIRVRYLRALENEEWDVLPGGAYTRSFIRTYANHLGPAPDCRSRAGRSPCWSRLVCSSC